MHVAHFRALRLRTLCKTANTNAIHLHFTQLRHLSTKNDLLMELAKAGAGDKRLRPTCVLPDSCSEDGSISTSGKDGLTAADMSTATLIYDTSHPLPPEFVQWFVRKRVKGSDEHGNRHLSEGRWIFARCCGKIGSATHQSDGKIAISTVGPCDKAWQAAVATHDGQILLANKSKNQAATHGGNVAQWSCCGQTAIPSWQAAWEAPKQRRIPAGEWLLPCDKAAISASAGRGKSGEPGDASIESKRLRSTLYEDAAYAAVLATLSTAASTASLKPTSSAPKPNIPADVLRFFEIEDCVDEQEVKEALWLKRYGGWGCAERAALVGDKVLALCVSKYLTAKYTALEAGVLTDRMKDFTSNQALGHVLNKLIGYSPAISKHELGTVFESLLFSTYTMRGLKTANRIMSVVLAFLEDEYDSGVLVRACATQTPLALLGQLSQRAKVVIPVMEVRQRPSAVHRTGEFQAYFAPDKARDSALWKLESSWHGSKSAARQQLAELVLDNLGFSERVEQLAKSKGLGR